MATVDGHVAGGVAGAGSVGMGETPRGKGAASPRRPGPGQAAGPPGRAGRRVAESGERRRAEPGPPRRRRGPPLLPRRRAHTAHRASRGRELLRFGLRAVPSRRSRFPASRARASRVAASKTASSASSSAARRSPRPGPRIAALTEPDIATHVSTESASSHSSLLPRLAAWPRRPGEKRRKPFVVL